MNLLLENDDFVAADRARLSGGHHKHLHEVHRAKAGDRLNGLMDKHDICL